MRKGKELLFLILVSQLVSLMGKAHSTFFLFPFSFMFSAIDSIGMGSSSSSSSPVGSSNIYGYSPKGSSSSQPSKKMESWLFEGVGVFEKSFSKLSLFLQGMKKMFLFCFVFF